MTIKIKELINYSLTKPTIIFPAIQLRTYMESVFSSGTPPVLYHACQWVAKEMVDHALERNPLKKEESIQLIKSIFKVQNWGELEFLEHKDFSGIIRINNCFECKTIISPIKDCFMVRGLLSGGLSAVFGQNIIAFEKKCRFRGDEHCEVIFKPFSST